MKMASRFWLGAFLCIGVVIKSLGFVNIEEKFNVAQVHLHMQHMLVNEKMILKYNKFFIDL